MDRQEQFLEVIERDEAERRWRAVLSCSPLGEESVPLASALGRVASREVVSPVNVPGFDRSNYDGFAVRSEATHGATEHAPRFLNLTGATITPGKIPDDELALGAARSIATGGMIPRGADAVILVENCDVDGNRLRLERAVAAGHGITFTGTDITAGETVLWRGDLLTSRETGVLAAVGVTEFQVWRKVRVGIISTGDEIIAPGERMQPGSVYDSNGQILSDAVRECGGEPHFLGIVRDDLAALRSMTDEALATTDFLLLSGGTSKGRGDLCYRAVSELTDPGIVVHGVALKPGKPLCLAASQGKPIAILPGFPTSAIFTFWEFVAPLLCEMGGRRPSRHDEVNATLPARVNSETGRTEYLLVNLLPSEQGLTALPLGKGSGSVTTFSRADGFITIPRHTEILDAGSPARVKLLAEEIRPADLLVVGSHCLGLEFLLNELRVEGFSTKFFAAGSTTGLQVARRGECDLAGIHLFDAKSGTYNTPFLDDSLRLIPGYRRKQGIVFRRDDPRFRGITRETLLERLKSDPDCVMVNRNQGSGTRILIDGLLDELRPPGYSVQVTSHHAVVAAILQGRADWGVAIQSVARDARLGFLDMTDEHFDFVVPRKRLDRSAVVAFRRILEDPHIRNRLENWGFASK